MAHTLHIVLVHVHVQPHLVESFRAATLANAGESIKEPGVARFDVVQDLDDRTRFVLIEAYHGPEGAAAHKETAHYRQWRDTVASMMAEPRTSRKFVNVTEDDTW
ncbi:MAG: antibiotic biosynthesis monooxygenase [Polyangia bacterium]